MLLSKACEYGIKACIYVASLPNNAQKAGAIEVSEKIHAPTPFTAKILKQLGKAKVISSAKGPRGGFFMTAEQADQPLMNVVTAIDGDRLFKGCALGLSRCSETQPCPLHRQYAPIRDKLTLMMNENSIRDLAGSYDSGQAFLATIVPED